MSPTVPGEGGRIAERLSTPDGVAEMGAFTGAVKQRQIVRYGAFEALVTMRLLTVYGCEPLGQKLE